MSAAVEAFFEACRLPEAKPGQRVRLLGYSNSAVRGTTNEVRGADGLFPLSFYFGSKKACLQFMADAGLDCVNLPDWGVQQLPTPRMFTDQVKAP